MLFLANLAQKGLQGSAQVLMPPSDGWGSLHHGNRPCTLLFCGSCLSILKKLKKQGQLGKQGFHILNHRALRASTGLGREPGGQHTSAEQQQDTRVPWACGGSCCSRASPCGGPELSGGGSSCDCYPCPLRLSIKASFPLLATPWEKQAWLGSGGGSWGGYTSRLGLEAMGLGSQTPDPTVLRSSWAGPSRTVSSAGPASAAGAGTQLAGLSLSCLISLISALFLSLRCLLTGSLRSLSFILKI